MSQHVTISDVAKAAGVSVTTISRYLNGHYQKMSAQTKERIDATINQLHYVPAASARRLRQTQSHLVGVLVGDIANISHHCSARESMISCSQQVMMYC